MSLVGAGVLLEVGCTRLLAFKLPPSQAVVLVGLSLLGLGLGGLAVLAVPRRPGASGAAARCVPALLGGTATAVALLALAKLPLDSGAAGVAQTARLAALGGALLLPMLALGAALAILLQRGSAGAPAALLCSAGLAAPASLLLLDATSPAGCVLAGGALLAAAGTSRGKAGACCALLAAVLSAWAMLPAALPEPLPDRTAKHLTPETILAHTRWTALHRLDVAELPEGGDALRAILFEGVWTAPLRRSDGDFSGRAGLESGSVALPYRVLGRAPSAVAVLGVAGAEELVAALRSGAARVDAVEESAASVSLLREAFAGYTGEIHREPRLRLVVDAPRAFLARGATRYDLVILSPPRAPSPLLSVSAAPLLSAQLHRYTREGIARALERLAPDGLLVARFVEFDYEGAPWQTVRFLRGARQAASRLGIVRFGSGVAVVTQAGFGELVTLLVKRSPFTRGEIARLLECVRATPGGVVRYAGGHLFHRGPVSDVLGASHGSPRGAHEEGGVASSDDAPLAAGAAGRASAVGLWLVLALVAACGSLLLVGRPRRQSLPRPLATASWLGATGAALALFEIGFAQRLVLLLSPPPGALAWALAVFFTCCGIGSLAATRGSARRAAVSLLAAIGVATLLGLSLLPMVRAALAAPFAARLLLAAVLTLPAGLALGGLCTLAWRALVRAAPGRPQALVWGTAAAALGFAVAAPLAAALGLAFGFGSGLVVGGALAAAAATGLRSALAS